MKKNIVWYIVKILVYIMCLLFTMTLIGLSNVYSVIAIAMITSMLYCIVIENLTNK